MLKSILINSILLFIFSINCQAQQWTFGVRGSVNYCDVIKKIKNTPPNNVYILYYTKPRAGGDLSFIAQKLITDKWGVDFSLGYSLKGGKYNAFMGVGPDRKMGTSHYLQFSPALTYKPLFQKIPLDIIAGLNVGYLLGSDMLANEEHEKWEISWSFGLEYLIRNIGFSIKYQRSVTPFYVTDGGIPVGDVKYSYFNSSFQLGGTYYFR